MDDEDAPPKGGEIIDFHQPWKKTPVRYSEALAEEIALIYANSCKGIPTLCAERLNSWPTPAAIWQWRRKYTDFDEAMDAARLNRAQAFADDTIEIADSIERDLLNGEPNPVAVARDKLRVEARQKWLLLMVPERYGNGADRNRSAGYLPQDEAIKYLK